MYMLKLACVFPLFKLCDGLVGMPTAALRLWMQFLPVAWRTAARQALPQAQQELLSATGRLTQHAAYSQGRVTLQDGHKQDD